VVAAKLIDIGTEGRQRIDRYELVAEIASGGMATVFLARVQGIGGFQRFVAIKRLHPHLATESEFVQMFLDEARLAAGIHHPNVVPILEVGASDRGYYLVMEYIEGDTLARLLARAATKGARIPRPIGLRVIIDMLQGLHAAHELRDERNELTGLVHRDVSPQNVLVGIDGVTRITDFGVARAATRLTATRVGQLKGKIAYMAPEQATGAADVDRRADVFSSGIVLWEVLAARRLFKAENEAATLSRVISEPIPVLHQIEPAVHQQVSEIVMKALERDPEKRFTNCQQFADALERAAVAVDSIAPPRELATYVSEVLGNEIAQQREAVRTWLARSEVSQAMGPEARPGPPDTSYPTVSGVAPASRSVVTTSSRTVPLAALAGGLAALVIAGIAMLAAGGKDKRPAAEAAPPVTAAAQAPVAAGQPVTPAVPSASASAAPVPAESASASAQQDAASPKTGKRAVGRARPRAQDDTPKPGPAPKQDLPDMSNPYR
jgi:serine/threonine-protein kinase